jgi:hypothetical protein
VVGAVAARRGRAARGLTPWRRARRARRRRRRGGTFTDLAAIAEDGRVRTAKVLSRPADQSVGVLDALAALGEPASSVARVVHGRRS